MGIACPFDHRVSLKEQEESKISRLKKRAEASVELTRSCTYTDRHWFLFETVSKKFHLYLKKVGLNGSI